MTQHPQADILRAIADGQQIQDKTNDGWTNVPAQFALRVVANRSCGFLRIKPATITLNGTELPKPVPPFKADQYHLSLSSGNDADDDNDGRCFWFNTREDRDAVYAKLVEVLGS